MTNVPGTYGGQIRSPGRAHEAETVQMRRTNGQKTQMINTIVGCPATLRFGVVQDRLRYLSEKDALRRFRSFG